MAAQGVPAFYVESPSKRIRSFLWSSDTAPPGAMEHLHKPLSQGGREILDLTAVSEAIKFLDNNRPLASDAALTIIVKILLKTITEKLPAESTPKRPHPTVHM